RFGVTREGYWEEMLNSDAKIYGGSGYGNMGGVESTPVPSHGKFQSISLVLPPLGVVIMRSREEHSEREGTISADEALAG
ncbi:MAG: alpha amylase C-terminal domain-containing protein, partial [Acidobacteriota bacterium]